LKINKQIAKKLSAYGLGAALVLAGAGTVSEFEGKSNKAYLDPVKIATICYGETKQVKIGDYKTDEECYESLAEDLLAHDKILMSVVRVPMTDYQHAAFLSFLYNVGPGKKGVKDGFVQLKKTGAPSTMLRKLNSGDYEGACNEFLNWMQQGQGMSGIEKRRRAEMSMCKGEYQNEVKKQSQSN
jgi:lysozyme